MRGATLRNDVAFVCGLASGCLYLVALTSGGQIGLVCGCLSWLLLIWVGSEICQRLLPQSLAPRALLCVQAIQPLGLLGVILSGVETRVVGVDLAEYPSIVSGAQMCGVFGVVLAGGLLWFLGGSTARRRGGFPILRAIPNGSEKLIFVAVVFGSLRQLASLALAGDLRYLILVLSAPLEFVAFAAGRLSDEHRMWRRAALTVLVAGAAVGFLLGTRQAVVGIALYGIGRISTLRGMRLWQTLLGFGICAVPVFYLVGLVGVVRGVTGRDDISLLDPRNISRFIDQVTESSRSEGTEGTSDAIKENSFGRLFAWPTAVVTIMTPDPIPFLGLESLLEDSVKYARITGGGEEAVQWALDENIGNTRTRDYGFLVNHFTSTEFNLIADGWARSGPIGVILVVGIMCLALTILEWSVSALRGLNGSSKLLLICILLSVAAGTRVYPLLTVLRMLLLDTAAWTGLLLLAQYGPRKQSSSAGRPLRATRYQRQESLERVRQNRPLCGIGGRR